MLQNKPSSADLLNQLGVMPRVKPYHRAKLIGSHGEVSPLCAKRPKALDLSKDMWTTDDSAVTCPKCKAMIGGHHVAD